MSESSGNLKVSAVEYLNTKPIVYGLEKNKAGHRFDITYDIPSLCSAKLLNKEADLALVPSIEYSRIRRHRSLSIVPEIAITSHNEVKSVELFFNKDLSNIEKIAVDASSRTSVALMQIILREKYDIDAAMVTMSPDIPKMLQEADAALVIGDPALEQYDLMDNRLDLGEEWNDLTDGLPFVYSFWSGSQGALKTGDIKALIGSRDEGVRHLNEIAQTYAAQRNGHEADFYVDYLTDNIQFYLGKEEIAGLKEFYSYCYFFGIIDEIPELYFFEGV